MKNHSATDFIQYRNKLRVKYVLLALFLCVILFLTALWRITQGEWYIPLYRVAELLSPFLSEAERLLPEAIIVRSVRLPRFAAAVGAGGLLAVAGVVLQGLLLNPLAEPYTLGIAAGAAFGGTLGFFIGSSAVTPMAFIGALCALWMVSSIAWFGAKGSREYLVLAGIITNAILSAGVTFLKAMSDDRLGAIVLWLMGSFSGASASSARMVWIALVALLIPSFIYARQLDAVSLSDGQGDFLGVDEKKLRMILLFSASFGTAVTVSNFGIIGFVGLVIPHLIKILLGPPHRPLLIFSFLGGGCLLSLADGVAQNIGELPVGVITALIGGPFFFWMLVRKKIS